MDNNNIATLQDYQFLIETSFKKMEKLTKDFTILDQSQQNISLNTLNKEYENVKINIGLMNSELSSLKEETNSIKWKKIICDLQLIQDSYKVKIDKMKNKKNNNNIINDPLSIDIKVDMTQMSSQQVINRGDNILHSDRGAIGRMKKIVNKDLDTMREINRELLGQNENLENSGKEIKEIDYSLNRAGKQIKTMAKIFATDKLIICMIFFILFVIIAIIILSFFFNGNENTNSKYDSFNNGN